MPKSEQIILPKYDKTLIEHYSDFIDLFPDAVFVLTDDEVYRFEQKPLARWLGDHIDFNHLCLAYHEGHFSLKEYMQFYQDIGYSLCGFSEIFGEVITQMEEKRITFRELDQHPEIAKE